MLRFALATVLVLAAPARAEDVCDTRCMIDDVRAMLARGETEAARKQLVRLYSETQLAELLFALGQVEFQLEHYEAAIGYYERFLATNPPDDQIQMSQQAIDAARIQIEIAKRKPKPEPPKPPPLPPPPPRYEPRWDAIDTVLVAAGGAAMLVGGGLLYNANQIGNDMSGTLGEYDDRLEHAQFRRFMGVAAIAGGAMTIGVALVRWRLDRTEVKPTTVGAAPLDGGALVTVRRPW